MLALLMAGGKGTRLGSGVEKPLVEFDGKPFAAHVIAALAESEIENVVMVTSLCTPRTTRWARDSRVRVLVAPGHGYIEDYQWAMKRLCLQGPVLVISADLPLITHRLIDTIVRLRARIETPALGVYRTSDSREEGPEVCNRTLLESSTRLVPTGINIVDASLADQPQSETMLVVRDTAQLWNINANGDLERLIAHRSEAQKRG
ncbi:MAG TPA: NTP transferase domain-containing protein [Candidatus Acidoferrales bacterium]|nr:NTP transferase domain-containing protein [Candidatus Acidoferrales bacterium]